MDVVEEKGFVLLMALRGREMRNLIVWFVLAMILLATGCAFHNETSWGVGDSPTISTNSQRTISGRSARD